jgi:hypothetical protein
VLAASAAHAQQSEAERRRAHLPYVRAATDCLARSIAANDSAMTEAASGRWNEAVRIVIQVCTSQLQQMTGAHDLIYGGGGMDFFRGPYLSDVPRALSTRLKGDLERRATALAEMQRRETEANEQRQRAAREQEQVRVTVVAEALKTFRECITNEAAALVPFSNENADILASVAETKCTQSRDRIATTIQAVWNQSAQESRTFAADLIRDERQKLVASIVTVRAAAVAGRSGGNPLSSPPGNQTVPASPPGRAF